MNSMSTSSPPFNGVATGSVAKRKLKFLFAITAFAMVFYIIIQDDNDVEEIKYTTNIRRMSDTAENIDNNNIDSNDDAGVERKEEEEEEEEEEVGWIRPAKVFGLIHAAKTAGTEINGELANHFERVCGNKGFSYNAYQENLPSTLAAEYYENEKMEETTSSSHSNNTAISETRDLSLSYSEVEDVGFEDCDYIVIEHPYRFWFQIAKTVGQMELHLPCRDPLEHLMSQCNFRQNTVGQIEHAFRCDAEDLEAEVQSCLVHMDNKPGDRFAFALQEDPKIDLKCFDPIPVQEYVDYMGGILQRKRIESKYVHRETNLPRDRDSECIWTAGEEFQKKVVSILMKKDYYRFCADCLGSENQLGYQSGHPNGEVVSESHTDEVVGSEKKLEESQVEESFDNAE